MLDEPGREIVRELPNGDVDRYRFNGARFEVSSHMHGCEPIAWQEVDPPFSSLCGESYPFRFHWLDEWEAEKKAKGSIEHGLSLLTWERVDRDNLRTVLHSFLNYDVIPAIRREMEKK